MCIGKDLNSEWEQIAVAGGATNPHKTHGGAGGRRSKQQGNSAERFDIERWILAKCQPTATAHSVLRY